MSVCGRPASAARKGRSQRTGIAAIPNQQRPANAQRQFYSSGKLAAHSPKWPVRLPIAYPLPIASRQRSGESFGK